ncbi:MAG TPA: PKD domain-containing protein, partial [Chitinophagaceae bacterium]|nr:PKD domain-containing protein [Chitinophagaceae bacterium]
MKNLLHGNHINYKGSILIFFFLLLHITVFSQLKADFSSNDSSGCALLVIQFQDNSTGNPTSWQWDLGNGTISDKRNPSTFYFDPGVYTIKLTVKNAAGEADSI